MNPLKSSHFFSTIILLIDLKNLDIYGKACPLLVTASSIDGHQNANVHRFKFMKAIFIDNTGLFFIFFRVIEPVRIRKKRDFNIEAKELVF